MLATIHKNRLNSALGSATIDTCHGAEVQPTKAERLTGNEAARLAEREDVIEQGRWSVYLAGLALKTIREQRLTAHTTPVTRIMLSNDGNTAEVGPTR